MAYTPRILIIDDEPQICDSLRLLLKRQGYDIVTANSGAEGMALLAAADYDLLLLDMVIPDMSGLQILEHLNGNAASPHTIVITGNASIESAVQALRRGAYDYLKKPFEYEELLTRVGNALQQKKLARETKRINSELERTEERYQYLVQNSPDIIYVLDGDGCFTFVNSTVERLLGYPAPDLLGTPLQKIVHSESRAAYDRHFSPVAPAINGRTQASVVLKLCPRGSKDVFKLFEIEQTPLRAGAPERHGVYGVARDVTYRKKLEEQLQQAKKMEALGTLAGGIAHDFNNILTGIMGYTSLMIAELAPGSQVHRKLQSIEDYVRSGATLTKQLLRFARGRSRDARPVNINDVVERTVSMFGRTKRELRMESTCEDRLWSVEVDEGQLEQVLMNFYMNAWQAMPTGGTISVTTANCLLNEQHVPHADMAPGRYVTVEVRDTGTGMTEEVRQRVFEPFFTTKGPDTGTGLGLASAYGIVADHGGTITVHSRPGQGTVFTVYLPASDKPVEEKQPVKTGVLHGTETVLLVDDESAILEVGAEILQALGYTPLIAQTGEEAIGLLESRPDGISLAIIDLVMPGMSGGDLCDTIKSRNPHVKLLLSSGYSREGTVAAVLERSSCDGFLQKPFAMKDLAAKLREILDA